MHNQGLGALCSVRSRIWVLDLLWVPKYIYEPVLGVALNKLRPVYIFSWILMFRLLPTIVSHPDLFPKGFPPPPHTLRFPLPEALLNFAGTG